MTAIPGGSKIKRVGLIGNSPPRLCGLATFTRDVHQALAAAFPDIAVDLYAMNDPGSNHSYGPEVACTIAQDDIADYRRAAQAINDSGADVVLVQHEYGIFGGSAGAHLLKLLDRVDAPVVVTLHTVLEQPNADQRTVLDALARRASRLIVMAEKGREILARVHGLAWSKIAVVPHGVPDRAAVPSAEMKPQFGFDGRRVLLTFGLLSPNKGIETMIRAMPAIAAAHPEALYVVLGATHPHLVAREGEAYRESLMALAEELGVSGSVRFIDGFLEQEDLLDYLQAADLYVTPYLNETQITSGTLSYAVALGKPVVSTPYWHAAELLRDGLGVLVSFGDSRCFAEEIISLLDDDDRVRRMSDRAYAAGRTMLWSRLAEAYVSICTEAARGRAIRLPVANRGVDRRSAVIRLDSIERMTDRTGMIQHSIFAVPDRNHGYCVDDNCRALMLMHRVEGEQAARADRLATIYASFVQHAWNGELGRFRNFMGFDRGWLEAEGSEDSFGRSVWAIGVTAAEAHAQDMRRWALHLFDQVAPHSLELGSLRTWAFALLGAEAVLRQHRDHALAKRMVREFGERLLAELRRERKDDWTWFQSVLAYDNARLPEALLRAGDLLGEQAMIDEGLAALAWLDAKQTNKRGQFRAVGTDSFGQEYREPLPFDQQPLEAWATVDAMLAAHGLTGEQRWQDAAWRAHNWYLGDNDLDMPIATTADGGCFDGLMSDRVNLNQGAESILAFQFSCAAMAKLANVGVVPGQTPLMAAEA
ncbi:glycosyltransferase family 4 protein [uncultured Sphingomonas sp.]|uniref:glycosyltransferase family 4 protein n=1 Tax=uncultured Sphingomonas sp. TaxID=158754 RepID=UPI0025F35B1B|nr:glycosyltransferase family 4 protein [uncultured Sphingomonas sp.]